MIDVTFIGFGELGTALAEGLNRAGGHALRVYSRPSSDPRADRALEARLRAVGAERTTSLEEAIRGAGNVLVVVPASASREVAERSVAHLSDGALYADLTAAPPAAKAATSESIGSVGAAYADVAVLGTVAASGYRVPLLASGPGAKQLRSLLTRASPSVTAIEAPAGHATLVKLLRSIYMKGRDALVLEMMLAAHRYGLEQPVVDSIAGPGEEVSFSALSERILTALGIHAGRRAAELASSRDVVREAGIDPVVTAAGTERLARLARLELRRLFHGERPGSAAEVLHAIEQRSDEPSAPLPEP